MTENRPLAKYAWCDWHNWLISHIPKTMKKSVGKIKVCNKEYHQVFFPNARQERLQVVLMINNQV